MSSSGKGAYKAPCDKLLHFDFNGTFDSQSCYNFAKGDPYGNPSLDGDVLCLTDGQFLTVNTIHVDYYVSNVFSRCIDIVFWLLLFPIPVP